MPLTRAPLGALAGFAATAPMTLLMAALHRGLPAPEQYPLPPAEIVDVLVARVGLKPRLTSGQERALIFLGHFGYGAAGGAALAALTPNTAPRPVARGVAWALLLWVTSYLGWLPLLGILRPATRHPARRNALMLAAHVLYGAALGALLGGVAQGEPT